MIKLANETLVQNVKELRNLLDNLEGNEHELRRTRSESRKVTYEN